MPANLTEEVVQAAQSAQAKWGIPASVSLAQYGLESGWGAHMPAGSNNPFGIKARPGEPSVMVPTHEYVGGRFVAVQAGFRVFASLADAFDAHAELLATQPVYAWAIKALPAVFTFINRMALHYATDPHYALLLTNIITQDGLTKYDQPAGGNGSPAQTEGQ